MPATRKLSVRPDAPMWAVYLVNGKMAMIETDDQILTWNISQTATERPA